LYTRLPGDGASMPKHVAVFKTCVQFFILLYKVGGECVEYKTKSHN